MPPTVANLHDTIPAELPAELFTPLVAGVGCRLERIVSAGHVSPPDAWYDQETDEWVVLLAGQARLCFADPPATVELGPGDYLHIPAHTRHRVDWTSTLPRCLWLALHYAPA